MTWTPERDDPLDAFVAWVAVRDPELADKIGAARKGDAPARRRRPVSLRPAPASHRSNARILARLRREAPALAAEVDAGHKSAHAAALKMRWEQPRIRVTNAESIARALARHMTPDDLRLLHALIGSEMGEPQ